MLLYQEEDLHYSKYKQSLVSFDEVGDYDQKDAEGFIKISSLRLKN